MVSVSYAKTATVVLSMLLLAAATINAQEALPQTESASQQAAAEQVMMQQRFQVNPAALIPGNVGFRRRMQNYGGAYGYVPPTTISYSSPYGGTYNYNYNSNPSGHQYVYEYNNGAYRYGYQNPGAGAGYGTNGFTYTGPGPLPQILYRPLAGRR